ncbi:MAG: hypothetical protein JWP54_1047, partial [Cryobacterium sp.]|nr:hypothetical protein [Cryobacterium sp.]
MRVGAGTSGAVRAELTAAGLDGEIWQCPV